MTARLLAAVCACTIGLGVCSAQAEILNVAQDSSATGIQRNVWGITTGLIQFDFIEFDVSNVIGHRIDSAMLLIDVVDMVRSSGTVDLRLLANAWSEETLTFFNQPASSGPLAIVPVTYADVGGTISVDITSIVQGWADGTIPNYGLALTSSDTTGMNVLLGSGTAMIDVRLGSAEGYAPAQVELNWKPPSTRTDGTALSPGEIGGYILRMNGRVLSDGISADTATLTVGDLWPGEYCFAIAARDLDGRIGPFSAAQCWSIQPGLAQL